MYEPHEIMRIFALNIERFAFQRGWSLSVLCDQLGISRNTVERLRYGQATYINPELLAAALEVFEVEPNDLLLPNPEIEHRYADSKRTASV